MSTAVPETLEATAMPKAPRPRQAEVAVGSAPELLEPDDAFGRGALPIMVDDPTLKRTWERPRRERAVRIAIFGMACLVFLPNLGAFGLWDPWETHYGAVTTEMLDTYDWISPWWGYRGKIGTEPPQGNYFYSKPVFIFWSEAVMSRAIGRGEWALRLPMAILAILAVFLTYLTLSKVWSRRVGVLGSVMLMTSPFFFMTSRQAQTDMPVVALMTCAMLFLVLALFGPREPMSDRRFKRWTWLTVGFVGLNTLPQYGLLLSDIEKPALGVGLAAIFTVALVATWGWFLRTWRRELRRDGLSEAFKDRWLRRFYLVAFYVFVAQAFYAKGLFGFLLPGAIILVYQVASGNWRILKRVEIVRGILLFMAVSLPWYVAMLAIHGQAYWNRFFIHDHFKRVASGVHQIDSGTFEHFIKWLGVGTFPWVAFVPLALFWLVKIKARDNEARNQAKLFFAIWLLFGFTFFTWSSTKFHHYIFPVVPALMVITALFVDKLLEDHHAWLARLSAVVGIVFFTAVAVDIREDPQHIRNLMTYKYDRPMPKQLPLADDGKVSPTGKYTWKDSYFYKHISPTLRGILQFEPFEYKRFITFFLLAGLLVLALFFVAKTRGGALVALGALSALLAFWSLNYYMPSLTPHWSQKYLFDAYYEDCTKMPLDQETIDAFEPFTVKLGLTELDDEASRGSWTTGMLRGEYKTICEEDVITWLITWRGETYYSWNESKAIAKKEQFLPYLEDYNGGRKFYILIERGKTSSLRSELVSHSNSLKRKKVAGFTDIKDWTVEVLNDENLYFQMAVATPVRDP